MDILTRWMKKNGIEDPSEATKEEKEVIEHYKGILSKEEITIEDLKIFIEDQIGVIETKWADLGVDEFKKAELIPYHTTYKALLRAINAPKAERESLEKHLISQLK